MKTAAGRRGHPLLGIARDALIDQEDMRLLGGPASEWTRRDLAFVTKSGYPVEPRNLARSFERIIGHAKLRPIRLHDLRHTTATLLKDLGVPVRDTMEILGHSRIAVTLESYTGADDASRLEAIERLNRLLEGRSA